MVKLLSTISIILAIVLFPPATLAFISNNAVPGDAAYPIKRSLENVILAVVSVNPSSKAWFSQTRSDTRFKELTVLIAQGKETSNTLNELVEQTNIAAGQIAQVTNEGEKAKLIEQLSASIEKYDQGLQQFTTLDNTSPEAVTALPPATLPGQSTPRPTFPPTPIPTSQPTPSPTAVATPSPQTPIPTIQATPRSTQPTPTPAAPARDEEAERQRQREIEEARRRLEEIKKKLEEQRRERQQRKQESNDRKDKKEVKQDEKENLTPNQDADKIEEEKQ